MSIEITTILELIQVFLLYFCSVLLFPYMVIHKQLHRCSLTRKITLCFLIGNFYIINVVYLIFLLHIGNRYTTILFTIVPAIMAYFFINRPKLLRFIRLLYIALSRYLLGEAKLRNILTLLFHKPRRIIRRTVRNTFFYLRHHFIEFILLTTSFAYVIWYYSYQTIHRSGYGTSDLTVHNKWINQMDGGTIFCNGIYPFGFHNIIFFLHSISGIENVVFIRVFGVVQTTMIFFMLYALLKTICKSRFTPILALFLYSVPDLINFQATMRMQFALPQEFAMVFLYPCALFLIEFFARKQSEIAEEKKLRKEHKLYSWMTLYHLRPSTISLIFFAISVSLTLAIHFYVTIVAFVLCFAIALGYFPIVFFPRYLSSIAVAGIISLLVAVAPMGIAFAQGYPLEGSLNWALGVMNTSVNTHSANTSTTQKQKAATGSAIDSQAKGQSNDPHATNSSSKQNSVSLLQKGNFFVHIVITKLHKTIHHIEKRYQISHQELLIGISWAINSYPFPEYALYILEIFIVLSFFLSLFIHRAPVRNFFSLSVYSLLLLLLLCSPLLNLPNLMDYNRVRIFFAYSYPLLLAFFVDFIYRIFAKLFRSHVLTEILPLGLGIILLVLTISHHLVKPLNYSYALQSKGSMVCDYRIMKHYPTKKWTIVSTTDDLNIIQDKGWHMEICDFLKPMRDYTKNSVVKIPTQYIFVFIEKKVLNYAAVSQIDKSMQYLGNVSVKEARKEATYTGSSIYHDENRWIIESKLYYWAHAFQAKFPHEFKVYYEDSDFICYKIRQNELNLYNFAIDYGYND